MSLSILENGSSDRRSAVEVHGFALLTLSFQTLGIIYSDIGTSPLYVLNGIWHADHPAPSEEDVGGGISAIVWALTILPLLKYVLICLRFGTTEGEGGTYALFQGLFPPERKDPEADRILTGDSFKKSVVSKTKREALVASSSPHGVFTPAVSVTSAVSGIAIAKPSVGDDVIPILIADSSPVIVYTLDNSIFQVTFIWLALLASTGIVNIISYPGIFRAFDPSRAIMLFVRTRDYDLLAGVLLAITGCEALFANLGQFNMASIQLSFASFVYPSLVLAYLGQDVINIHVLMLMGRIIYVFAILATALITATFSLVQQLINMRNVPAFRMVYTSDTIQGQVYIPSVNWALMVFTIIVVAAFKSPTALTNAYGFAVSTVMFTTTILIAFQFKYVKRLPAILAIGFFIVFGFFDEDTFDGSTRRNLRHIIVCKDNRSKLRIGDEKLEKTSAQIEHSSDASEEVELEKETYYVLDRRASNTNTDVDVDGDGDVPLKALARIPTCAIFHKMNTGRGVPHAFSSFYGVTYCLGFRDDFDVQIGEIMDRICTLETQANSQDSASLEEIREATLSTTHIVPHYIVKSKNVEGSKLDMIRNWCRRFLVEEIYRCISTMFPETANWLGAADE
ncbi:hypothetical protein EW026_g7186 [Hermanssonia centrifuga]|uniref:K+ potassium transporter integral membrane domain-containing protein n=1 Tax=Hermanssonia centrifuga TaxID=98765 RepID=A0A4S4K8L9_9APHY|nr:hypothetical protein EW026_g7186 [Hermanssonia centrifuga]